MNTANIRMIGSTSTRANNISTGMKKLSLSKRDIYLYFNSITVPAGPTSVGTPFFQFRVHLPVSRVKRVLRQVFTLAGNAMSRKLKKSIMRAVKAKVNCGVMAVVPDNKNRRKPEETSPDSTHWLLRARVKTGIHSPHVWIITALFAVFTYVYYGIMADYQDVYVIIFFYPLIYAALVYRLRGVIISGLVFLAILFSYTFLFDYDAVSLMRTLIFALFAFLVSSLTATLLNYLEHQIELNRQIFSLNNELNDYIERLQRTQQQLIQAAKLSSIGQLSASVAHELNNPLAGVLVYTKLIKEKITNENFDREKVQNSLEKIESAIDFCTGIIRGLLDFARQTEPLLRPVTISRAIDKAMSLVGHQAKMKLIEVVREESSSLPLVVADFNQLVQVIINLVVNAVQAMSEGSTLMVRTSVEDGWVRISVQDTGCGVPPENMDKLFTPFFTTKDEVKGVGLGLAVSYGIIERHGGRIEVQSEVGKGSTFTIVLPAYQEEERAKPDQSLTNHRPTAS
jgi:signal transduction histidine kinase